MLDSSAAAHVAAAPLHRLQALRHFQSTDVFGKCNALAEALAEPATRERYEWQHRLVVDGALDHRIRVADGNGGFRELVCFDSNSYLGLHRHPRVLEAVRRALAVHGYGTPSAQLLCGTSRPLRDLEDTISSFHGRAATLIFPSGYATNIGVLTALLGPDDCCVRDRFVHASIHDGCRWSGCGTAAVYPHVDVAALERIARRRRGANGGLLIATDGVFSMHGRVAPLPELRALADRLDARLMVDDAHGLGVLGATGHGIEEHFDLVGAADVLVGTFSKACGSVGGYVTGSQALIDYLRLFAHPAMFTASLPAALCAGLSEAFRLIAEDDEPRQRLWRNTRRAWELLRSAGLLVNDPESPILVVTIGCDALLGTVAAELLDEGIKCGTVSYPAVPLNESILRIAVSASHTDADIELLARALGAAAARHPALLEMTAP
jgi:4-hydroxy-2,2'-bipyrrole-5-methanol synthase